METHAGICGNSGVEVRVVPGRKSPFRFRREIISQRGNATGLSVTTIIVNNAARGYSRVTQMTAVYTSLCWGMFTRAFLARAFTAFDNMRLVCVMREMEKRYGTGSVRYVVTRRYVCIESIVIGDKILRCDTREEDYARITRSNERWFRFQATQCVISRMSCLLFI